MRAAPRWIAPNPLPLTADTLWELSNNLWYVTEDETNFEGASGLIRCDPGSGAL